MKRAATCFCAILLALLLPAAGCSGPPPGRGGPAAETGPAAARAPGVPAPVLEPGAVRTSPAQMPALEKLALDLDSYPRTDGSTSAEPLGTWIVSRLAGLDARWAGTRTGRERRLVPLAGKIGPEADGQSLQLMYTDPGHSLSFLEDGKWVEAARTHEIYGRTRHRGTHTAYRRLIEGEADLIFECRLPSADEKALMEERGVELKAVPFALDAFVFLRRADNPVEGLTSDQVRGIYTPGEDPRRGLVENWSQVGGPDLPVNAYVRNRNSGSQETLETIVMKGRETVSGRHMVVQAMSGPYNHLYRDPAGIGFTFFYYQVYMAPPDGGPGHFGLPPPIPAAEPEKPGIAMFAVDGITPSRDSIADGSWPWVTKVYAVTRKGLGENHPARILRDWLLSGEGQAVVAETGYLPLR